MDQVVPILEEVGRQDGAVGRSLAITQTLLDVARQDPNCDTDELLVRGEETN